jgi:hypothetical protein
MARDIETERSRRYRKSQKKLGIGVEVNAG